MMYDVYSYGNGCYAYFAKVVKNYDDNEKNQMHYGEVMVQAVPYGVDFDGSVDKLESPLGRVWLPYLCDLTGADARREKETAKQDRLGFGFHCMPEVGSLVVVLAVESGLPGYAQHVVIGSFWNKQLLPPQLDDFSYKIAGETEYKMDHLKGDGENAIQQLADTRYYRTKSGATFLLDDVKKIFGFYKLPAKEKDAKKKAKLTRYFMVDEENANLDIKTGMFYVCAENINIKVGKGLTIDNKQDDGQFYVGTDKGLLNAHAQKDKFDVNAKNEINKYGKKINLNKGKKKDPNNAKADNPSPTDPVDPDKDEKQKEQKFFNLAIRRILEINVLREDEKFMGEGNVIRVDKGTMPYSGDKDKPDTMTVKGVELSIQVVENDFNLIMAPIDDVFGDDKKLYELVSDDIVEPTSKVFTKFERTSKDTWKGHKEKNPNADPRGWLEANNALIEADLDLNQITAEDGKETVDVIRRVVFKCNKRPEGKSLEVRVHYLDPKITFPGECSSDGIIKPSYTAKDNAIVLETFTKSTWRTVLSENDGANAAKLKPLLAAKDYYVNIPKTLKDGDVSSSDANHYFGSKEDDKNKGPGVIKFTVAPVSMYSSSQTAKAADQLSVTLVDPDICGIPEAYANFKYRKGDDNNLQNVDTVSMDSYLVKDPEADNAEGVDVWVRYRVVRSLPLVFLCREVNVYPLPDNATKGDRERFNNRRDVSDRKFPVFDKDVYGLDSLTDGGAAEGNLLWRFVPCCTTADKYKSLLNLKYSSAIQERWRQAGGAFDDADPQIPPDSNNDTPAFLYVEDTDYGKSDLKTYLKYDNNNYKGNADNDRLIAYPGHFDNKSDDDEAARNSLKIARKVDWEKNNFIMDNFRAVKNNKRERKNANGSVTEEYFSPEGPLIFAFWERLDELYSNKGLGQGGNNPDIFRNYLNYTFAYLAGYLNSGNAEIFRSKSLERTVHGDLDSDEAKKMKDRLGE
ncbi:MAG TPA: hypothetical protein DCO86_00220 [Spirochaetaceae bacterium]|nr:hypothetical protein [Spirochaetaceae bacterium]